MTTTSNAEQKDHAYQNAQGWAHSIAELVAALECDYDRLQELRDADELPEVPEDFEVKMLADGDKAEDRATCGTCGRSWDNAIVTSTTPAPSARCPFEYYHKSAYDVEELHELTAAATLDGDLQTDADAVREHIQESILGMEVRSGWTNVGDALNAEEFTILLSTGGPALRIRGELDQYKQPHRAWLEYQDWGTPWIEYHGEGCSQETLLTFCQQFYFGE